MIKTQKTFTKKLLICCLLLLSLITLSSCKEEEKTLNDVIAIGYIGNDIYLINSHNDSLLLEGFDLIQENIDEFMYFRKDGKYGYIDITGKEIIAPTYDKAYAIKEKKAVVVKDEIHYIIDSTGKELYKLPTNVTSNSYFSCNRLVVEKDGKFAYLIYNEDTGTFTLPGEFTYDYALPFSEGYAVVGQETIVETEAGAPGEVSVKYNYLGLDNILLFEEYLYDEATPFSSGIAKVGLFKKDVKVEAIGTTGNANTYPRYYDLMVYNFIYPTGKFVIDQETLLPLEVHYGEVASDGIINTALMKHYVNDTIEVNLFKKYTFYTPNGEKAYDSCFQYTSTSSINVFWPTNLVELGGNHIFACGKQSISWSFQVAIENELQFMPLYITINNETWIEELAHEYYTNTLYIENVLRYPYHIGNIKRPEYSQDTRPIVVAQVNFNDNGKYGIMQFDYDSTKYEQTYSYEGAYSVYYLIAPIYDRIVI